MKTLSFWIIIYILWGCWNTCSKINKNLVYTGHIHLHLPISPCNRSDVNLSCFMLLFWSSCLLNTDNIPCVFLYPYLLFTVNVGLYIILMWTLKYQSDPDSYWSSHKSIGFPLTIRSYFCAGAHAYKGFLRMMTFWNLLLKLFEENSNIHSSLGVQDADLGEERNREGI